LQRNSKGGKSHQAAKNRRNQIVKCCGVESCFGSENNAKENTTKIKRGQVTRFGMKSVKSFSILFNEGQFEFELNVCDS
jgi:hypothetical protein